MVCKINSDLLQEELDFFNEVEFMDDLDILYECQYAMAYGCQALATNHCDNGEACLDI